MAHGGARSRSGPPPSVQSLARQRDGKEWTRLPAEGRLAPAPEWPLAVIEPSADELLKWRQMWTMPQALVWEADQAVDIVAFYVRTFLEAMKPKAGAQARTFVRTLSADLLLTPDSLMRARYVIAGSDDDRALQAAAEGHPAGKGRTPRAGSARDRFTVVSNEDDEAKEAAGAAESAARDLDDESEDE